MATNEDIETAPKNRGGIKAAIVVTAALIAGGASFWASYKGLTSPPKHAEESKSKATDHYQDKKNKSTEYFELDPVTVSIGQPGLYHHLRFSAFLETQAQHIDFLKKKKPKIMDLINTYLNAVDSKSFENPNAMIEIRRQTLRRLQIVISQEKISDLLIKEFIIQ